MGNSTPTCLSSRSQKWQSGCSTHKSCHANLGGWPWMARITFVNSLNERL